MAEGKSKTGVVKKRASKREKKDWIAAYIFIAPVTLGLLVFYIWPLIVNTSMDKMTLGPALSTLQGQYTTKYPMQMAGAVMAVIPIIVLFFIFQKQFIEGVAQSGIKG